MQRPVRAKSERGRVISASDNAASTRPERVTPRELGMQQGGLDSLRAYPASSQEGETDQDRTSQASLQASHNTHERQLGQAQHDPSVSVQSQSASDSRQDDLEAEMDVSPTTPPGRSTSAASPRPPDAPRKAKQSRPPIQLSPHAPVRKLDFDHAPFLMRSLGSEQSCESHHSGPGRG